MLNHSNSLYPHPPDFEQFLYSPVGKDRNSNVVTVLSALARLDLDRWAETAALVSMDHCAARVRLAQLLSQLRDVPGLKRSAGQVAQDLSLLLPDRQAPGPRPSKKELAQGQQVTIIVIWSLLALVLFMVHFLSITIWGVAE
ncbi:hypothetical protein [Sulfitobacter dubius]|uniref:hypothetical protein n=1 Tax=Sulfitobacter dubius TaxID=218673 RepID=UPI0008EF96C0|nr:hypothetical protein [Sulfitobacter dubius]SFH13755.1 hypothetical protein SAMN04488039_103250 [Sulfitobacter dubius]